MYRVEITTYFEISPDSLYLLHQCQLPKEFNPNKTWEFILMFYKKKNVMLNT